MAASTNDSKSIKFKVKWNYIDPMLGSRAARC